MPEAFHRLAQAGSGMQALATSRAMLEHAVRARVLGLPNVAVRERVDVVGLRMATGNVTGVSVLARDAGASAEVLPAGLVVDASGRRSRAPEWLAVLGFPVPREQTLAIDLRYTSCEVELPDGALGGNDALIVGPTPHAPRNGILQRIEGGRAMLTLAGYSGEQPPTTWEAMVAWAGTLSVPDLQGELSAARPATTPVAFRYPGARWRR